MQVEPDSKPYRIYYLCRKPIFKKISKGMDEEQPVDLGAANNPMPIRGIALSSHLKERGVSQRKADTAAGQLSAAGHGADIEILEDTRENPAYAGAAVQRGAALLLWGRTPAGCMFGSDLCR